MKKKKQKKINTVVQKISLSGINVKDLFKPKVIKEMNNKLTITPFMAGFDINGENIIIIGHHDPNEAERKILNVECKFSSNGKSNLENFVKILKKMVK